MKSLLPKSPSIHVRILTFAALFFALGLVSRASVADCIDYDQYLHWVSGVGTTTTAYGVACRGEYAYTSSDYAFEVIDVSNPQTPRVVGSTPIGVGGADIVLFGHYAYVADYRSGILVINIEDPQNPTIVGGVGTNGLAIGLCLKDDHLYLSTANAGYPAGSKLEIFSILADPISPQLDGMAPLPHYGWDVAVKGNYAYVADDVSGIVTIDVSDPSDPEYVGTRDTPGVAHGIAVWGDILYIADFYSLQVATIHVPDSPQMLGAVGMPSNAFSVATYGDYVCVGDYEAGLKVVDATNPAAPRIVGTVDTPGVSYTVAIGGTLAYIADGTSLQIASLSTTPTDVPTVAVGTPGAGNGIAVSGDYAYVADYGSGLQIVQVSNIPAPQVVGSVDTPGSAVGVAIAGTKALVADGGAGLVDVNIAQPAHPTILGIMGTPGFAHHVATADAENPVRHAYIADGSSGLLVADISGDTPIIVGSVHTGNGEALTVVASGEYVFVADTGYGLVIIDASDPAHPTIVSSVASGNGTSGVAVQGTHVYIVNGLGLSIFDVSDIIHPSLVGFLPLRYVVWPTVTVDGDTAYVGGPNHEFTIVDISNPSAPKVIGGIRSSGYPVRGAVANCSLYIADQMLGLLIAPAQEAGISDATNPKLEVPSVILRASPNPLTDRTQVFFDLSSAESADLQVFDVGGRRVRQLLRGGTSAGRHVVAWDGRDDAGRPVASGTYFLRLKWAGGTASDRLILLR